MAQSPQASNHLLASLGSDELAALLPHLKTVELPQETVFFESGDAIKAVYFPHNALISLVVDLACGGMIEAAMIGAHAAIVANELVRNSSQAVTVSVLSEDGVLLAKAAAPFR